MAIPMRLGRRQRGGQFLQRQVGLGGRFLHRFRLRFSSQRFFRAIIICLAFVALLPPLFFHFRLKRFHQIRERNCGWLNDPPLVCAHGGDSTKAFPNTMAAYHMALRSQADCIEIDVSRSSDGVLFALHDRDLQRMSGNSTSKVGYLSTKEIRELGSAHQSVQKFHDESIPTLEDALTLISSSVRQVILDAKVGPPSYEKGLAKDIISVVERTQCKNCLVWAKSDNLARDVIKLSPDIVVGYIVMKDPSTGARTNLLRMRGAGVVGVYHPLVDEKLVKILHGYEVHLMYMNLQARLHSIRAVRFHIYIWLFTGRIKRSTPGLLMIQIRCKRCCLSVWMLLLQAILLYFNVECKISEPNVSRKAFFCHDDIHLFQVRNVIPMTEPCLPLTRYIEVLNTFTDFRLKNTLVTEIS